MEKILSKGMVALCALTMLWSSVDAQSAWIYGASATQDSLWAIDTSNYSVVQRLAPSLAGQTVTGIPGLAYDPIGHTNYCLLRLNALPNTTVLATIDLGTGVCTQVGNLGKLFSTITFRADGQLIGVVSDAGGANAEQMFLIDKSNASNALATALGNGDNGEVICYHSGDGQLYHWSGSSNMVFEKLPAALPFTPMTMIPTLGAAGGEITGAVYVGNNRFITASASSDLRPLSTNGQYGAALASSPSPLSGLVMPPRFTPLDPVICLNETMTWNFSGMASDTAIYNWGDGTIDHVFPAGPATHSYLSPGNLVARAGLKNGVGGYDTLATVNVLVLALPGMFLAPANDTIMCLNDSLRLTSSFGGTSRWYRNGILIPGATTNIYDATQSGWYNMTKTNSNGCTDSVDRGISVIFANHAPAPSIGLDTTGCPTVLFQANDPFGNSWSWDFGDGGTANGQYPAHTYNAVGTYQVRVVAVNECYTASDSVDVIIGCFIGSENAGKIACSIAPNPNAGTMLLNADLEAAANLSYTISDLSGRVLHTHIERDARSAWRIPVDFQAPAGVYFMVVNAGDRQMTLRLLIE